MRCAGPTSRASGCGTSLHKVSAREQGAVHTGSALPGWIHFCLYRVGGHCFDGRKSRLRPPARAGIPGCTSKLRIYVLTERCHFDLSHGGSVSNSRVRGARRPGSGRRSIHASAQPVSVAGQLAAAVSRHPRSTVSNGLLGAPQLAIIPSHKSNAQTFIAFIATARAASCHWHNGAVSGDEGQ